MLIIPCEFCGSRVPQEAYYAHCVSCAGNGLNSAFAVDDRDDYDTNIGIQESMGGAVMKACKDINAAAPITDDPCMQTCAVCLTPANDVTRVRKASVCGHEFCAECLEKWLGEHTTCPLCVCDLSSEGGHRFVFDADQRIAVPVVVVASYSVVSPPRSPTDSASSSTRDLIYHLGEMRHILGMGRW